VLALLGLVVMAVSWLLDRRHHLDRGRAAGPRAAPDAVAGAVAGAVTDAVADAGPTTSRHSTVGSD
jgi:hypothetical protein